MGRVFLSYRRDDSAGHTGRIYDRLVARWGRHAVFMDLSGVAPGDNFAGVIDTQLANTEAVIVVIGTRWLESRDDESRRRIDDPQDLHRLEIERAIARGVRLIPVLVGGAHMPSGRELPVSLRGLAARNACELNDQRFDFDVDALAVTIERDGAIRGRAASTVARLPRPLTFSAAIAIVAVAAVALWRYSARDSGVTASRPALSSPSTGAADNANRAPPSIHPVQNPAASAGSGSQPGQNPAPDANAPQSAAASDGGIAVNASGSASVRISK